MIHNTSLPEPISATRISVLVLLNSWSLPIIYQQQLLMLAKKKQVQELILISRQEPQLSPPLAQEPKLRTFQLFAGSFSLMAEAATFEAAADILLLLKPEFTLSQQVLEELQQAIKEGIGFGGLIRKRNRWWAGLLKAATVYCKRLCWFRFSQGYFVSRRVFHQSGGFKHDGKLLSFSELLCKQEQLSSYKFIFF